MSIARLKLDEASKLDFGVLITGADGKPEARFVIEGKDFSVSFPCTPTNDGVQTEIQGLDKIFTAGEYNARLEIVLENKIYTPLIDKIEFEPSVHIETKSSVAKPVKESVTVAKVTIQKNVVNEEQLRKTQAATIIAQSLGYHPSNNQTPQQIVNSALAQSGPMTEVQMVTVKEMLELAVDMGIEYNEALVPEVFEEILPELAPIVEEKQEHDDEGYSDEELDDLADSVSEEDLLDIMESGDVHIMDEETGEVVDELTEDLDESQLDEVLSRSERIRAKVRFSKTSSNRERKLKIALTKHSSSETINKRARALAIKALKMKMAKKPLNQLSTADKERIERKIATKKNVINRLAMKMAIRVRKIEKERLTAKSTK